MPVLTWMLGPRTGGTYNPLTSIGDWNREFSELVRRGAGEPGDVAPAGGEQPVEPDVPVSDADSERDVAGRRLSIAAQLARLGFVAADRATPENPAVQVLGELLPADAELGLCLTCHGFSSSAPYPFSETTGVFPNLGSFRMNPALAEVSPHGAPLLTAPRRELVVCTQVALSWTASHVRSDRQDVVTLYSAQFRDIVGATVRHRRKGVVEVWVQDGPALSFRVEPEAAEALSAHVDQAAQSQ
ncbi:MAG: hypothetical protein JO286_01515 [Solirubrobacterales bacterium]|nr:hypothetical protein [Solirubrobacterales bacterium]